MTTLPSTVSTTLNLSTDDNPISHLNFDDNSNPGDYDISMKTNRSTDSDQSRRESTHYPLEHDLHELNLNDSLKPAENIKGEPSISLPTIPSDPSNPSSSPIKPQPCIVSDQTRYL
jgi:hypothetical protein